VEIENGPDVFCGPLFVRVVAAIGQHQEFSVEEMLVEGHSLFHVKDETAVRVNDEAGADHGAKGASEVKVVFSIGPTG
jgi:hypothetical protein